MLLAVVAMACSTAEQQTEPAAKQVRQPETGAAGAEQPMQVTDPVCGMVTTTASEHRVMHGGKAYYFCSPACAEAFAQDPQAYIKAEEPDVSSER
jgi:YHS domain-containing protein